MDEIHIGLAIGGPLDGHTLRGSYPRITVPVQRDGLFEMRVYSWRNGAWWYDLEKPCGGT